MQDEECDLFPLLRRRAEPDDEFDVLLGLLQDEHAVNEEYYRDVLGPLRTMAGGGKPARPDAFAARARAFSIFVRRQLAWENSAILPLACKRLAPEDLRTLGQKMAALRGIQMNPSSCHLNRDYG